MAVVPSSSWQKALWPGVDQWFNDSYQSHEVEYSQIFQQKTSKKAFEQAVGQSLLGLASIKGQGAGISYDDMQQTYINNFVHAVYALGVIITWEAYQDNQYNLDALSAKPKALAKSMRETKEWVHANILNRAFNSSYTMGASSDGKELCNSAHLNGPYGATASNALTAADLAETPLEDALVAVMGATDPRGIKINIMPDSLVIPPAQFFLARRILGSDKQNDTANNAINVLKVDNSLPGGIKINHYLTDTDAWFVTTSVNKSGQGLVTYNAYDMAFGMDNDFDTFNMKSKAFERYSAGWVDWRSIYGNAGA